MKYIFFILTLFGLVLATADPMPLVWDYGTRVGDIDNSDIIVDISKSCDTRDYVLHSPSRKKLFAKELKRLKSIKLDTNMPFVDSVYANFSIQKAAADMVTIVDAYSGTGELLFVLLPEVHNSYYDKKCDVNCSNRHKTINLSRSYVSGLLAKNAFEKNLQVSNYQEGPNNDYVEVSNFNLHDKTYEEKFKIITDDGATTPFLVLANTYNQFELDSSFLERPEDIFVFILLVYGEFNHKISFKKALRNVRSSYFQGINKWNLKKAYDYLRGKSEEELKLIFDNKCEMRSSSIVKNAMSLAEKNESQLVFLSFGAGHHYGISKALRENKLNYISIVGKPEVEI